jgi:uncharacterized membrane protein
MHSHEFGARHLPAQAPRSHMRHWRAAEQRVDAPRSPAPDPVARNVEEIARIEARDRVGMAWPERLANVITAFAGSMFFVALHAVWFGGWIAVNAVSGMAFDPPPFGVLTLIVSLEAIFLSTFVLISQNRQALQADRRAKVDLQVNMVAEQEITKLIELVRDLHDHIGTGRDHDPVLERMQRETHVAEIADAVDEAEKRTDPEGAEGPDSAIDTEA